MQPAPTAIDNRLHLLDALRGLAIFGILMVNMPLMYRPISKIMLNHSLGEGPGEVAVDWLIKVFFEGKFYVLFSALFGYGFYLFLHKASGSMALHLRFFKRRLVWLLLFGLAHVTFLWAGDILVFYALFGFILIAFRNSTTRRQTVWACIFIAIPIVLSTSIFLLVQLASMVPEGAAQTQASIAESQMHNQSIIASAAEAYSSGTYVDTIHWRWQEYLLMLPGIIFFYPTVLGIFLLGFLAARLKLVSEYRLHLPFWRKSRVLGWALGLPLAVLYAYASHRTPPGNPLSQWAVLGSTAHVLGGLFLSLGYVSWVVMRYASGHDRFWNQYMAPVGRMALTNYLGHSVIAVFLFHGVGLGLFGKIEAWQSVLLAVAIFGVQIFASRWWLARFRFGPAEWLWRSLTYGKLQPMRYRTAQAKGLP